MADFILEFDYRSDNGPRHVGPFTSRDEAFAWAERTIGGGSAEYQTYPLASPRQTQAIAPADMPPERRCVTNPIAVVTSAARL